jgi:hypothetical protein
MNRLRRVLTLRPTKMLAKNLGLRIPAAPPLVTSRVADSCVHTFPMAREPWLIFCNTASLYPVFAKGLDVTDDETLIRRAVGMIQRVLLENGYAEQSARIGRELSSGVQWAPIPDRSVLGSINDFIQMADYHFEDADLTPAILSQRLGKTPMSTIGMTHPARAFATLRT